METLILLVTIGIVLCAIKIYYICNTREIVVPIDLKHFPTPPSNIVIIQNPSSEISIGTPYKV
jgi:hypothetical protein